MTGIDFHFNAPDKVLHACRLLRKAVRLNDEARLVVIGEAEALDAVDAALWAFSAVDFVAHCRSDSAPEMVARSPVLLLDAGAVPPAHRQVLVNIGKALPAGFERFERLIDIVSDEAEDRQIGRARWKHYASRGYAIAAHDFGKAEA
ncbi:MAG: DNA polymerase III subunit chi [Variovorax sp.]|nr:MAG: DNA polymerase III subunit chi [Variovorax sp.]